MTIVRIFALFGKKKSQREGEKKEELEILAQLIDYAALQQFALWLLLQKYIIISTTAWM